MNRPTCIACVLTVTAILLAAGFAGSCGGPSNDGGNGNASNDNGNPPINGGGLAARVYGRVFDASTNSALPGVRVTVSDMSVSGDSDAEGRFVVEVPGGGDVALTARRDGYTYAQRRATVEEGGLAAVADMFLTPVDPNAILIGPEGGSGMNSDGSIELTVPAGALGATAELRATWYDEGRHLPNDLPGLSHFTYACDLTPDGQTFDAPVTVRMRNTRGFAPGTPIPVGVYNPTTLAWEHESMGTVTADGEWVEYQVVHFSPRDCNLGRTSPTGSGEPGDAEDTTSDQRAERNNQPCGSVPTGSRVDVGDGHLIVEHLTPSYTTLGRRRTVALQYNSPVPAGGVVLELTYDISLTRTLLPERQRLIAEIGGNRVERTYEPVDGPATFAFRWDGRDPMGQLLPTGTYPYTLTLVNEYETTFATVNEFGGAAQGDTGVTADEYLGMESSFTGSVVLPEPDDTLINNPYGYGWGIVGLHRLTVSGNQAVIVGGDGSRFGYTEQGVGGYAAGRGDSATLVRNPDGSHTWSHPDGMVVSFDADGHQTRLADRNGNATTFAYSAGRITTITDPVGRATTLTYDEVNRLRAITDPAGRQTQFTVNAVGDLERIENPDGTARRFSYDGLHRMTAQTDAGDHVTSYTFDASGAVTRVDRPDGTSTQHVAATEGQASYTDPAGEEYAFAVNSFGTRTAITDPMGRTLLMGRDRNDQITTVQTASGKRSDYAYDSSGNLTSASGFGRSPVWPDTLGITYNDLNLPTRIEDSMAGAWTADYDDRGNLTQATLPGGRRYSCTYNDRGQRTGVTIGDESTTMTYDANGNLETVTDGEGGVWRYGYDSYGNISDVTDADGRHWSISYNVMNLVDQVTNGLSETIRFSYAPARGSLDIDLGGAVAVMTAITDGRGNTTTFDYDAMYRPAAITDALGNATTYAYDANGRLTSRTEPTGASVSFAYNSTGQLTQRTQSAGESATYTYDPETGLCTSMETPSCRLEFTYNWFDLVTDVTTIFPSSGLTATVSYEYRTSNYSETLITLAKGEAVSDFGYEWSPSGGWWPTSLYGGAYFWLQPEYDTAGRPASWYESYSGTESTFSHDGAGRMTSSALVGSGGSESASWTYSPAGYRTRMEDRDGVHTYAYDDAGRLIEATHPTPDNPAEQYSYDGAGNRFVAGLEAEYAYDAANRLNRDPTFDYTYDASGNLARRTNRGTSETTSYTYDAENRLVSAELPDGTVVSFAYDPLGRRIEKRVGADVTYYVYEGDEVLAEFNAAGGLRRQFVLGQGIDMLEGLKEGGFASYENDFYLRDPLGTILGVTDAYGESQTTYRYQAFGEPVLMDGALGDWRLFAGREYDVDTGLYHYRRRYYDPGTGRFLQRDPLPVAWALSPYAYTGNNPVNARDPFGLDPASEAGAFGSFADQWVVQPGINIAISEGLGHIGGLIDAAPFPYSPAAGVFTVAGVAWGQYYGTDGLPSWSDVISVYGASNPAEAGITWYGSQWWNPARSYLDDFLTLGGLLPRREARLGPVCGLREGLRSFFGY
ncbi:MAG: hypothetical protein J5J06_18660 [Phycisphaerae bacterium]|nr:hypothetical protein [Phycisphaerae bacterium]